MLRKVWGELNMTMNVRRISENVRECMGTFGNFQKMYERSHGANFEQQVSIVLQLLLHIRKANTFL